MYTAVIGKEWKVKRSTCRWLIVLKLSTPLPYYSSMLKLALWFWCFIHWCWISSCITLTFVDQIFIQVVKQSPSTTDHLILPEPICVTQQIYNRITVCLEVWYAASDNFPLNHKSHVENCSHSLPTCGHYKKSPCTNMGIWDMLYTFTGWYVNML